MSNSVDKMYKDAFGNTKSEGRRFDSIISNEKAKTINSKQDILDSVNTLLRELKV